ATSVFYADYIDNSNSITFEGNTRITNNVGGPVLSIFNNGLTENDGNMRFFDNTLIKNNKTGTSYAVYASKDCKFNLGFAGIATVSENRNDSGREANIYLNDRLKTSIVTEGGRKLQAMSSVLYFSTDTEQPICIWNEDTIYDISAPGLYIEDHLKTDNQSTSDQFVIYKANEADYTIYVGKRTDAITIRGYLTSTISTIKKMYARTNAFGVLMDNFTTPSEADFNLLPAEYKNYKFGGWIIKNSQGGYETLQYGKTKVNTSDEIALDAYWTTTNHDHKSCGCAKGDTNCTHGTSDDETWIVAFRESVFSMKEDGKFLLSEDITLTKAFTNPKRGFAICLNGHSLTRDYRYNLINITSDATDVDMSIVNCKKEGGIKVADDIRTNVPLIYVAENVNNQTPKIYLRNVAMNSIKYNGTEQGVLGVFNKADVTFEKVRINNTFVVSKALIVASGSKTTIIGGNDETSPDPSDSAISFSEGYFTGTQGMFRFNGGEVVFDKVEFVENHLQGGQGLIYLENMEKFTSNNSRYYENINDSNTNGAVFYLNNVKQATFNNDDINRNKTNKNGAVLYITDNTVESTVTMNNCYVGNNEAGTDGGAIYHSNNTNGNKFTLNLNNTLLEGNVAGGTSYGGGAISFYSDKSKNETENDVINITYDKNDTKYKSNETNLIFGNKANEGNGGFIYAMDTTVNVVSNDVLKFWNNIAGKNGGVFYLDKSILNLSSDDKVYAFGNESGEYGSVIYTAGADNNNGETTHKDKITLKNFAATDSNVSTNYQGVVAVGPYADMILDGSIYIDGSDSNNIGLYLFKNVTNPLRINETKVERKLGNNFSYTEASKIYVMTQYDDDVVVEGYTSHESYPIDNVFVKDENYEDGYTVYRSGTKTYRTVHIGNSQGKVHFDIGANARILYKDGTNERDLDRAQMLERTQPIPYDSGAELDPITNTGVVPTRTDSSDYAFAGWVTTVYDTNTRTYAINKFDFNTSQAYLPRYSENPELLQEDLYVIAMWQKPTGEYELTNYDQLFYKDGNDQIFLGNGDVEVSRPQPEALAPFNRDKKLTIDLSNSANKLIIKTDIKGFIDNTKQNEVVFKNLTLEYQNASPKVEPMIVADNLGFECVNVENFVMDTAFSDTNKVNISDANFESNERLTVKTKADGVNMQRVGFRENSAKEPGSSLYSRPAYPLIYLSSPSTITQGLLDNVVFENNHHIYSYIMTEQSMASVEQTIVISDCSFSIGKEGASEKAVTPILGGDYTAVIKSVHTSNASNTLGGIYIKNTTFETKTNIYNALIDAYETNLTIENNKFENLTFYQYLIRQEGYVRNPSLNLKDVEMTGNKISTKESGFLIMRRKSQDAVDSFVNTKIVGNSARYALYSYNTTDGNPAAPAYKFGGEVIIKDNRYQGQTKNTGDIYLADYGDDEKAISFDTTTPILPTSEIAFYRQTVKNGDMIAYNTWTPDSHDHATHRIFKMYDSAGSDNYIIYKDVHSLKVSRPGTNLYKEINLHLNNGSDEVSNASSVDTVQYIADGTFIDEPVAPTMTSYPFAGWFIEDLNTPNKYIQYNFQSVADDYRVYAATRSDIYAKWTNKKIKVTVWGNKGGRSLDGSIEFGDTTPTKVVYTISMGNTLSNKDSAIKYNNNTSAGNFADGDKFTREGLEEDGWYDSNGWNEGKNNGDWGNKWIYTESQWIADDDKSDSLTDGNLYVKWRGEEYNITYNANDTTGSTRAVYDTTGKVTKGYYNGVIGDGGKELPTPTRDGYTFINWHSDEPSKFADSNIVKAGETVYSWAKDITLYAEWQANKYKVLYEAGGEDTSYSMVDSTFTFDAEDTLRTNTYRVSGKDFSHWVATNSITGVVNRYEDGEKKVFNLATKSNAQVVLDARWKEQVRKVTFDLNKANNETSEPTINVSSISVAYGSKFGNLPTPQRKGYTFAGWYIVNTFANVDSPDDQYLITNDTVFNEELPKYGTQFVPYSLAGGVYTMNDIKLCARWENNLYTIKTTNGVAATEMLKPTGEDKVYETAFDFIGNRVGVSKKAPQFPARQYKREGYDYKGLYAKHDGKDLVLDNSTTNVYLNNGTALYNLGLDDIASGSEIVFKASWSEFTYDLIILSGHENYAVEGRIPKLIRGATKSEFKNRKYSRADKIKDLITEYEIDGYKFLRFTTDQGYKFGFDDVVSGASLSEIVKANGAVVTLTGVWEKNSYTIHYENATTAEEAAKVTGKLNDQKMVVGGAAESLYSVDKPSNISGTKLEYLGHAFDYWLDKETGATYSNAQKVYDLRTVQGAVATLSAVWKSNRYNIVFNVNTPKSATEDENVPTGNKANLNNLEFDKRYDIGEAGYSIKGYKVAKFANAKTLESATIIVTPSNATNRNYITELAGKNKDNETLNLYLIWEPEEYIVNLDMNDGNSSTKAIPKISTIAVTYDKKYSYNDVFTKLTNNAPTRPGYEFKGWTKTAVAPTETGVKIKTTDVFKPADVTVAEKLYAWWAPVKYKLTVNANTIGGQNGGVTRLGGNNT
ncbi:MAG: InlB B-repeat-containing protein, partial [Lachnospiraceae bacterium]|nr:InlB B-repeat-containing protein [Lachnospiraceae bacterium]